MRIAIVGAGGVGGYFGGMLARAGQGVVMLARGAHLEVLRARGIEIRIPGDRFTVAVEATDDPGRLGPVDYAIVAVKNYSLSGVAPVIRALAESGAVVLPLLNGVEVVDRLVGHAVPRGRILGGFTAISAARVGPGIVERKSALQRVVVGELGGGGSERAERIAGAFRESGAEAEVSGDITADVWRKFAFIASVAAACGLARSPVGPLRETPLGRLLIERAVREAVAVARSRGVALFDDEEARILRFIHSVPAAMKPSLLLDLEAGGPTEIDDFSGAIARLGREGGIETPAHDTAAAALGLAGNHQPASAGS
jgi:2-dehydropantoate 2-reductase